MSGRCMKFLLLWQSRTRKSKSEYTNITILIGFVSQLLFLKKKFNWKIQNYMFSNFRMHSIVAFTCSSIVLANIWLRMALLNKWIKMFLIILISVLIIIYLHFVFVIILRLFIAIVSTTGKHGCCWICSGKFLYRQRLGIIVDCII